jgi:hypothetical protein
VSVLLPAFLLLLLLEVGAAVGPFPASSLLLMLLMLF